MEEEVQKSSNKKLIWIIVAVIVVILVIIGIYYFSNSEFSKCLKDAEHSKNLNKNPSYWTEQYSKDLCYNIIAKEKKDLSFCNKIIELRQKDECYTNIALNTSNITLCDMAIFSDGGNLACYSYLAWKNNDPNICLKVVDIKDRDKCYFFVVYENKNKDLCGQIQNQTLNNRCLNISS